MEEFIGQQRGKVCRLDFLLQKGYSEIDSEYPFLLIYDKLLIKFFTLKLKVLKLIEIFSR
jgi:hypothetical protein